jgi:hypothetical protein
MVNDYGPYLNSVIITACLLVILWQQRDALISLLWSTQEGESAHARRLHWSIRLAIVLAVTAIMALAAILRLRIKPRY